ncbi:MAG: pteridine reductase [Oleiphilaceae bacterium]|nr:pteridine reductase [Oleiphilaceae bacterium]
MTHTAPVALITGAAHRIGAATASRLHERGYRIIIHYRQKQHRAEQLADTLNQSRPGSATTLQADLSDPKAIQKLSRDAIRYWERLDLLVNNAALFFPTPVGQIRDRDWDQLIQVNVRAPMALVEHCHEELALQHGCIINLLDIHADRPLPQHPLYNASKAALASLTRSWARDLAPDLRVNGVAPGAILWPEDHPPSQDQKQALLHQIPLGRLGQTEDIASAITWLACDAPYVTGQIITVDGGRSIRL